MQTALRKIPFCCRRDSGGRQPLYCVGKGPSLRGPKKASRYKGEAPAKVPLLLAVPRNGFVIAGTETAHKGAVQVEQGTREW